MSSAWGLSWGRSWGSSWGAIDEVAETKRSGVARLALYLLQEEDLRKRRELEVTTTEKPAKVETVVPIRRKRVVAKPREEKTRVREVVEEAPLTPRKPLYIPRAREQNDYLMTAVSNIIVATEFDRKILEAELKSDEEDEEIRMFLLVA